MKPFLKWAGNKYKIIERVKAALVEGNRLIEPFAGSGAAFLNTDYSHYLLAESNQDLIHLYQHLQKEGEEFIDYCKTFFASIYNNNDAFYALRELFNSTSDIRLKSALFVYLNKHCFNGLCRYNAKGKFNTPYGKYIQPYFPDKEMLFFYQKSQNTVFECADFIETMNKAVPGDVVYCDPPYVPLSVTSNFTSYSADGFNLEQQIQLAKTAEQLAEKGIPVIISNHNTEFTQQIYAKAKIEIFDVQRYISCKGNDRNKAGELLAIFN